MNPPVRASSFISICNRDYYRVRFGLDFISFVQKMRDALSKK
jgi:hypothetical protein